jgi:hypothetical protein
LSKLLSKTLTEPDGFEKQTKQRIIFWPCDSACLQTPSRERVLCFLSVSQVSAFFFFLQEMPTTDSHAHAHAHAPTNPKQCLLCNAGAGAAAGTIPFFFIFFSPA